MSQCSDIRGYQPDTTVPTSHHDTHRATYSSVPNQPQRRSIIERLEPQRSPRNGHDLWEQLNERRSNEAKQQKEIEDLQKKNERLRREQDILRRWMRLRAKFHCEGLSPPTFLDDERDPSEAPPQQSCTVISKKTMGRGVRSRKTLCSISEVGESHHMSKPSKEQGHCDRLRPKRHHYQQSPEHTWRTHSKKSRSVEIRPFAK